MKKKALIMFGLVILQLGLAYIILNLLMNSSGLQGANANKTKSEKGEVDSKKKKDFELLSFEVGEIVVNTKGSNGRRYFILDIIIMFPDYEKELPVLLEKNKTNLVDSIQSVLMGKDVDEISTPEGRMALRTLIQTTVEAVVGKPINQILFRKYLIQ
jgi:flagellar basal body-associated protein FliL